MQEHYCTNITYVKGHFSWPWARIMLPIYEKIIKFVNLYSMWTLATTELVYYKKVKALVREKETVSPVGRLICEESWTIWKGLFGKSLWKQHWDFSWLLAHWIVPEWALHYSWVLCRTAECPRQTCHGKESIWYVMWEWEFKRIVCGKAEKLLH